MRVGTRGWAVLLLLWTAGYVGYWVFSDNPTSPSETAPVSALDVRVTGDTSALSGRLTFLEQRAQPDYRIAQYDFETNDLRTAFAVPDGALVYQLGAHGVRVALTYSAPTERETDGLPHNGLYLLEPDGILRRIAGDDTEGDFYAHPVWAADGEHVYVARYSRDVPQHDLWRYNSTSGEGTLVAANATRPSVNGERVAFIRVAPETGNRSVWVLDGQNTQPREVVAATDYPDIGVVLLHEARLDFTVLAPTDTAQVGRTTPLAARLTGALTVFAHGNHDVPAQWYSVPLDGSAAPTPLTETTGVVRYAAASPDGEWIGYAGERGFYAMRPGGTAGAPVLTSRAIRALSWTSIPS